MDTDQSAAVSLREALGESLRYWEPRRLLFNGTLLLVVSAAFVAGWPTSKRVLSAEPVLVLFILAVLANIAYCAAYVPDLVVQHSPLRSRWLRWRWMLFALGTLFASAISYLFVAGMFGLSSDGNW
jgi:hypothetical protein